MISTMSPLGEQGKLRQVPDDVGACPPAGKTASGKTQGTIWDGVQVKVGKSRGHTWHILDSLLVAFKGCAGRGGSAVW